MNWLKILIKLSKINGGWLFRLLVQRELARASKPEQDDFWRDYNRMVSDGIKFVREPQVQDYGTVAVFEDLYGNLWNLLELSAVHPMVIRTL